MVQLSPSPILQFFDSNSVELVGGRLFTYEAGTTTKTSVYTDDTGSTPFPNPIPLNARGEPDNGSSDTSLGIWLVPGVSYKYVLAPPGTDDPPTSPIWSLDGLSTGGSTGGPQYVVDTGTTNALAVSLTPAPGSYTAGMAFLVQIANTTTGSTTINVNGLGTKAVVFYGPLGAGALLAGNVYLFVYDSAGHFEVLSVPGSSGWVTNAFLAPAPSGTVIGNSTGSTATPQYIAIAGLTGSGAYAVDSGAANAYVVTLSPAPANYTAGLNFRVKIANTNTAASTINVNGLGAIAIQYQGAAIKPGVLVGGLIYNLIYDGTEFQLISPPGVGAGGSTSIVLPSASASAGTVGSQGYYTDATGTLRQWAYVQLEDMDDDTPVTWDFPTTFPTGPLGAYCTNMCEFAGQTGSFAPRATASVESLNTTAMGVVLRNSDNTGTLCVFYLEVWGR